MARSSSVRRDPSISQFTDFSHTFGFFWRFITNQDCQTKSSTDPMSGRSDNPKYEELRWCFPHKQSHGHNVLVPDRELLLPTWTAMVRSLFARMSRDKVSVLFRSDYSIWINGYAANLV